MTVGGQAKALGNSIAGEALLLAVLQGVHLSVVQ